MVQSFVGNAADMNEFLIASYKGHFAYKSMSFAVWLWASLQFCFSCTSDDDFVSKSSNNVQLNIRRKSVFVKACQFIKRKVKVLYPIIIIDPYCSTVNLTNL